MRYIVGIDEVGRGSLAGPVVVSAVVIPKGLRIVNRKLGKLRDCKQLTPRQREHWFEYLRNYPRLTYATARVYPRVIERKNIARAANTAALRAFRRLTTRYPLPLTRCKVFLDGGLYLGSKNTQTPNAKTVIRGDEKFSAIKVASILAKVSRDRLMVRLAKEYPQYGFEIHKGYGTKRHLRAIRKYGPSTVHRLTFLSKSFSV